MRAITDHQTNAANRQLTVEAVDLPGAGGANHSYKITGFDSSRNPSDPYTKLFGAPAYESRILFQNGPIGEAGVNGLTHEVLLAILIDRLTSFQAGQYACEENGLALQALQAALDVLNKRTEKRVARGVEGTHAL